MHDCSGYGLRLSRARGWPLLLIVVGGFFFFVHELWGWSQLSTATVGLKLPGSTIDFGIADHGCFDDPCFSEGPGSGEAGVIAIEDSLTAINGVINPQFTITHSRFTMSAMPGTINSEPGRSLCDAMGKPNCIYFFDLDSNGSFGGITAAFISFNPLTGDITGCDVLFDDDTFNFSTTGVLGAFDVEGIANQEIGHCLGLDHSGIAGSFSTTTGLQVDGSSSGDFSLTSSMFHIAAFGVTDIQSLEPDDDAGLLTLYPPAGPTGNGSISGLVTNGTTGSAVKGAHVVAVNMADPTTPIVGSLSGVRPNTTAGSYRLENLTPGDYYVRIEPLVGTTNSFTEANTDASGFDTSFPAEFFGGESSTDRDFVKDGAAALTDAVTVSVAADTNTPMINLITNVLGGPTMLLATPALTPPAVLLSWNDV